MRADILAGSVFPDYELPDHAGRRRKLSEIQGGDPMIVVLSRGHYCPKDRRQHEGLLQLHREMEVGYCKLVTISTDKQMEQQRVPLRRRRALAVPVRSGAHDPADLDIAEYTDPAHNPMIPHTIVLEPGLVVFKVYIGYWFFGRPTVEELRQDLRMVLRKCRPDWDISDPDLKIAWQRGDKSQFYSYGKTACWRSRNK